jgi:transcriptional regulator with XRE-family HTH domain
MIKKYGPKKRAKVRWSVAGRLKRPLDLDFIHAELAHGRSQREIAKALGIDHMRIQRLLAKQSSVYAPDPEALEALLQAIRTKAPRDPGYPLIRGLKSLLKRNIPDLLALSVPNDPYYAGLPSTEQQAEWFAALWHRFQFPAGVHLRRIHYRLVSVETPIRLPNGICHIKILSHAPPSCRRPPSMRGTWGWWRRMPLQTIATPPRRSICRRRGIASPWASC